MHRLRSIQSSPQARKFIAQGILWLGAVITISVLWEVWYLPGPHGPFRWVGSDYVPYWVGVRNMFEGTTPYSAETVLDIQNTLYGGPALDHDPMMFVYPAWLFLVITPFAILPLKFSIVIFTGSLLWGVINFLCLLARQWSGSNTRLYMFWLFLLLLGSLPFIVIGIVRGQFVFVVLLALFASQRIWDQKPFWAGVLLAFAVIKPTVAVLPVTGFLIWALKEKNWKYLLGFAVSFAVMCLASWLAIGNWFRDYLSVLVNMGGMPVIGSLKILPWPGRILYFAFFVGVAVYGLVTSLKQKQRDFWCSAIILAGVALLPMRWIYDLYLCTLIPSNTKDLSRTSAFFVGFGVLFPWSLVIVPKDLRWSMAIIGIPVVWAIVLLVIQMQKKA